MTTKIINIEGWPAAGKTALWGLLDSHSEIFVEPLHVYCLEAFLNHNEPAKYSIREFRALLSNTEYYKSQQYAISGYFPISYNHENQINFTYNFDWYEFDKKFVESCVNIEITFEEIKNNYIKSYINAYKCDVKPNNIKYFATMTNYFHYKRNCYSGRTIVVIRSPIEIVASRLARKPRKEDGVRQQFFSPSESLLWRESELEEILTFNEYYSLKEKKYPNAYLCITLNDLLSSKNQSMKKISDFLDISFEETMLYASRDGINLDENKFGISLSAKVNDNSNDLLTFRQRVMFKFREYIWMLHKLPVNILSLRAILRFIYLKNKGLR